MISHDDMMGIVATEAVEAAHGSNPRTIPVRIDERLIGRLVVAFGGGVNSTAMLVEMDKRGITPKLILFADTGGERPETYETVKTVSAWCVEHGMPPILTVKHHSKAHGSQTLEDQCLRDKSLPSIAYGFKTCSIKFKIEPCDRVIAEWIEKKGGGKMTKAVGYDAGETRRVKPFVSELYENWHPLIEWGFWREDCEAICRAEGLPVAKSSCFFCPSMKKHEVLSLRREHPELADRAVALERNAELTTNKGLGRHWAWADLLKADADQMRLFVDAGTPEIACGCYDG